MKEHKTAAFKKGAQHLESGGGVWVKPGNQTVEEKDHHREKEAGRMWWRGQWGEGFRDEKKGKALPFREGEGEKKGGKVYLRRGASVRRARRKFSSKSVDIRREKKGYPTLRGKDMPPSPNRRQGIKKRRGRKKKKKKEG